MRLIEPPIGRIEPGSSIRLDGTELMTRDRSGMRRTLREDIGYIPQDPTSALDPLYTVGAQIDETLSASVPRRDRRNAIATILESLGIDNAAERMDCYPHEFSGGL